AAVAGWYPLYLFSSLYAGFRFGRGALFGNAIAGMLAFAVVALSTEAWRQQPILAGGLVLALGLLPALVLGAIRALAAARVEAAGTAADKLSALRLIADALQDPSLSRIDDVVDFAALESGAFTTPSE